MQEVSALWQSWAKVVGERALTIAVNHQGSIPQKTAAVKLTMKGHAQHYIHDKVATSRWPGISTQWLDTMALLSERWVGNIARYAVLRWAVNEEDDEWLHLRSQHHISRQVPCATCGILSCSFPLGGKEWAQCERCIARGDFHALNLPHHTLRPPVLHDAQSQLECGTCVACHQGDNTVGHWTLWSPVPVLALPVLLRHPIITSVNSAACLGSKQAAIASRTTHQFRIMLRDAGAMRHMTADMTREQPRWVELLTQKVFDELPTDLKLCERLVTTNNSECLLQNRSTDCVNSIPVHIARSLLPQRICVATQSLPRHALLGVFDYHTETVCLITGEITKGSGRVQNVTQRSVNCPCGALHVELYTTRPVQE